MPKIIENLEGRLIEEAQRQLQEFGYSAMTIRSVAKGCGVGVGTVYNYFPSKDALLASFMLQSWKKCLTEIEIVSQNSRTPAPVARSIYDRLMKFSEEHKLIVRDEAAASVFAGSFSKYHSLLRSQLASPLRKFCDSDFAAEFVAEALLTWSMAGKSFDEIYGILEKTVKSAVS